MASFESVNYSLRPSKTIQRQLVFEGIRSLQIIMALKDPVYVGLGSIWFTDFVMAHKLLHITDMISIEKDPVGYRRALFNAPYATVRVVQGHSTKVLPTLYVDPSLSGRPWVVWLDFDIEMNESLTDDVRSVIENAPQDSFFLITFNGKDIRYGNAKDRPHRLRDIFGDVVPDNLSRQQCKDAQMEQTLADVAIDFMISVSAEAARPGSFIPAFRAIYKDTSPMVTVGGIMASPDNIRKVQGAVERSSWRCRPLERIVAPHLTIREAATLQSALPREGSLTRRAVRSLKFDLEEEQIRIFEQYYKEYPAFVQMVS